MGRAAANLPAALHSRRTANSRTGFRLRCRRGCGLATARGNQHSQQALFSSGHAFILAWAVTLVFVALFAAVQLAPCLRWIREDGRIADISSDVATILAAVDGTIILLLMIFLAKATVAQPKPPLDVRSIGGGGGFAGRWFRILQAVPLKHTVAALVGFVLITSVTAALTVASVLTRPGLDRQLHSLLVHWEGFMDQLDGVIALLPSLPLPPLPSGVVAPDLHAWRPP